MTPIYFLVGMAAAHFMLGNFVAGAVILAVAWLAAMFACGLGQKK